MQSPILTKCANEKCRNTNTDPLIRLKDSWRNFLRNQSSFKTKVLRFLTVSRSRHVTSLNHIKDRTVVFLSLCIAYSYNGKHAKTARIPLQARALQDIMVFIVLIYLILRVETHVRCQGHVMYYHQDSCLDRTSETFCDSVRIHFSCYARVSCCCIIRVCLVVLSSLFRTFIQNVCRYAPILCSVKLPVIELFYKWSLSWD